MGVSSSLKSGTSHILCAITSAVFGFWYISTLFILALCKNFKAVPPAKTDRLPPAARKLVFDLAYYAKLEGYVLEDHDVITSDGFHLAINHIVSPDIVEEEKQRFPVLLIPGLMQSSSAYCTAGPNAIGFELVKAGYDVWLGNNRGGFHPHHEKYHRSSSKMWDWTMSDLATKDVPAMINFVKNQTKAEKIAIGAHSQGCTQTLTAFSIEAHGGMPDIGHSISSFSALAPAVFAGPLIDRWFLRLVRKGHAGFHMLLGYRGFIGVMCRMRNHLPLSFFTFSAYIVFNYMLGWDDKLWDPRYRSRNFIFAPVYVSSKLMFWWLGKGGFADTKCMFKTVDTKWFDSRFPPLEVYACGMDNLCLSDPLINHIHNFEPDVRDQFRIINLPSYSHLDVLWAMDANEKVAKPMAEFIWKNVADKNRWREPRL